MSADLDVEGLSVRFGGLLALDRVSLHGAAGRVTGLIGPNGAGKTTLFNACTGLVVPKQGTIRLDGRRLNGRSPARRAQWGLGRTFQRMELFDGMTVLDNVAMGPDAQLAGRYVWTQLWGTRRSRRTTLAQARQALQDCGIEHLSGRLAGGLSTGERRLVELARAVASRFRYLLLDEPSSGLDVGETARFGDLLSAIANQQGVGILLVEHDMALVRQICSYIYVLDFGELIHQGEATEVLGSDVVRTAYLGSTEVADSSTEVA
jgi:ABC-type branched-subunit amino acid transport system ATPase component